MPDRPTAERGHLPASIFERNRVWRWRNHPKTSENLIFCELRNFNSETSSLVTLPSSGESANFRSLPAAQRRDQNARIHQSQTRGKRSRFSRTVISTSPKARRSPPTSRILRPTLVIEVELVQGP